MKKIIFLLAVVVAFDGVAQTDLETALQKYGVSSINAMTTPAEVENIFKSVSTSDPYAEDVYMEICNKTNEFAIAISPYIVTKLDFSNGRTCEFYNTKQ